MKIFAVDDDRTVLQEMEKILSVLVPEAELETFDDSLQALARAREELVDVVFLDIEMPDLGGLDLGQYLKELNPQVNLVYVTRHEEYGLRALNLHASGYVLKPANEDLLKAELDDLRHPCTGKEGKRVFIQTFGNFEFFVDGKPVTFKYNRTKEMLAILVNNRGAQTSNGEIIASIWEDDGDPEKKTSYLSNLRQDLQNTLSRLKLTGLINKQRGSIPINVKIVECDLFYKKKKKKESQYHYLGDYMNQYSWPEYRHAELDEISYALYDD